MTFYPFSDVGVRRLTLHSQMTKSEVWELDRQAGSTSCAYQLGLLKTLGTLSLGLVRLRSAAERDEILACS